MTHELDDAQLAAGTLAELTAAIRVSLKQSEYKTIRGLEEDILACVSDSSCFDIANDGTIKRMDEATLQDLLEQVGEVKAPIVLLLLNEHKLISEREARASFKMVFGQKSDPDAIAMTRSAHEDEDDLPTDRTPPKLAGDNDVEIGVTRHYWRSAFPKGTGGGSKSVPVNSVTLPAVATSALANEGLTHADGRIHPMFHDDEEAHKALEEPKSWRAEDEPLIDSAAIKRAAYEVPPDDVPLYDRSRSEPTPDYLGDILSRSKDSEPKSR